VVHEIDDAGDGVEARAARDVVGGMKVRNALAGDNPLREEMVTDLEGGALGRRHRPPAPDRGTEKMTPSASGGPYRRRRLSPR
jgi:hypothetical protein